jgi:hypothetical protein
MVEVIKKYTELGMKSKQNSIMILKINCIWDLVENVIIKSQRMKQEPVFRNRIVTKSVTNLIPFPSKLSCNFFPNSFIIYFFKFFHMNSIICLYYLLYILLFMKVSLAICLSYVCLSALGV